MLEPRRMLVLAAAVREGSLAAAARSLGMTPSAASQAVSALEAQVGEALIERRHRGVVPTAAGERIAGHAEVIRAQLEAAEAGLAVPGSLRVAAFATAVAALVAPALDRLRRSGSVIGGSVLEAEPDEARELLARREVDLALVNHSAHTHPDDGGRWRVQHIVDEHLDVVMSLEHRLARRRSISLGDLAAEPWVMQAPASPCQEVIMRACGEARFAPRVTATCATYGSILALVAGGQGVALVPRVALACAHQHGWSAVPPRVPVLRRINVLTSAALPRSTALDEFVGALRDQAHLLHEATPL